MGAAAARRTTSQVVEIDTNVRVGDAAIRVICEVHWPENPRNSGAILFCTPGGGVSRRYFSLRDPEARPGPAMFDEPFNFTRAMTRAGHVVIVIDPVGVGESTRPADGYALTSDLVAEVNHLTLEQVLGHLRRGDLAAELKAMRNWPIVGIGHSAGAMLTALQQDRYRDFSALILLCFGARGLPAYADEVYRAILAAGFPTQAQIGDFARRMFGGAGYTDLPPHSVDSPAARALQQAVDRVVAPVAAHAMTPGNVARELAGIDVPVFLAVGERDMTGPPEQMINDYPSCPKLALTVVRNAGHHVFVSALSRQLNSAISRWIFQQVGGRNDPRI